MHSGTWASNWGVRTAGYMRSSLCGAACEAQTVRPAVLRLLWLGHFTAIISREHLGDRFRYLEVSILHAACCMHPSSSMHAFVFSMHVRLIEVRHSNIYYLLHTYASWVAAAFQLLLMQLLFLLLLLVVLL